MALFEKWDSYVFQGWNTYKNPIPDVTIRSEVVTGDICDIYWHGTKRENLASILTHGLKNGTREDLMLGPGVYLSIDPFEAATYGSLLPCGGTLVLGCSVSCVTKRYKNELVVDQECVAVKYIIILSETGCMAWKIM